MRHKSDIICPVCGERNIDAEEEGFADGPPEFHADCWFELEPAIQEAIGALEEDPGMRAEAARLDGALSRYDDAKYFRPATADEILGSLMAGERDGGVGAFTADVNGRPVKCYVS